MKTKNLLATVFFICASTMSFATSYTWTGIDSVFTNSNNWNPTGVPGITDTVIIVSQTNIPALSANYSVSRLVMTTGTLDLNGYDLTVQGSSSFSSGSIFNGKLILRGTSNIFSGTTFNTKLEVTSDRIELSGGVFNDSCFFETTGLDNSPGNGGCIFNDAVSMLHNGSGSYPFQLAITNGDEFNGNLIITNNSNGRFNIAEAGTTYFNGNVILNNTGANSIQFGYKGGQSILSSGNTITIGSGGGGYVSNALLLYNFVQLGNTSQTITLSGSAQLIIKDCQFNGNIVLTASEILCSYTTFNGTAEIIKSGPRTNYWYGGNIFNETATINNQGSGGDGDNLRLADMLPNTYNGDASFQSTAKPIQVVWNGGSDFRGDITINHSSITFQKGNVYFGGSNAQYLNGTVVYDFNNIIVDKSTQNIVANTPIEIGGKLELRNGLLYTTSTNLLTMKENSLALFAGNQSFVCGPVKKFGKSIFEFPVGKNGKFMPIEISAPVSATESFTAEYFDTEQAESNDIDTLIDVLDNCNYWSLVRNAGTTNVGVTINWKSGGCSVLDSTDVRLVGYNGSLWKSYGVQNFTGDLNDGKLSNSSTISDFNYFTFGYSVSHADYLPGLELCLLEASATSNCSNSPDTVDFGSFCNGALLAFSISNSSIDYIISRLNRNINYCLVWNFTGGSVAGPTSCLTYTDSLHSLYLNPGEYYFSAEVINNTSNNPVLKGGSLTTYRILITDSVQSTISATNIGNQFPLALMADSGYTSYLWSTGETSQVIDVNLSGSYMVTVTNGLGCQGSASIEVSNSIDPGDPGITVYTPITICDPHSITENITVNGISGTAQIFILEILPQLLDGNPVTGPPLNLSCYNLGPPSTQPVFIDLISVVGATFTLISPNTWEVTMTNPQSYPVSVEIVYDLRIDCSLVPQISSPTSIFLVHDIIVNYGILQHHKINTVLYPHIIHQNQINVQGSHGQIVTRDFEYRNNGYAPVNMYFEFLDLTLCTNAPYRVISLKYSVESGGVFTSPTNYNPIGNNQATLAINDILHIYQEVEMVGCTENCTNQKVQFNWSCSPITPGFCDDCQDVLITEYLFDVETPTFEVIRMAPVENLALHDIECCNVPVSWVVRIKNTSTYATLYDTHFIMEYGDPTTVNYLTLIDQNSIVITSIPTTSGIYLPAATVDILTPTATISSLCTIDVPLPVQKFEIMIRNLRDGEEIEFKFDTYRCCESDEGLSSILLNSPKFYNQWHYTAFSADTCHYQTDPSTTLPNQLEIVSTIPGSISGNATTPLVDVNLEAELELAGLTLDMNIPVGATPGPTPCEDTFSDDKAEFQINLKNLVGDVNDLQVFGYNAFNSSDQMNAILRVKIHCDQGLLIESPQNDVRIESKLNSSVWNHDYLGSFHTTSSPYCCEQGDYYFYFKISDLIPIPITNPLETFFENGTLIFNLLACCNTELPITPYDVEFSILQNEDCFDFVGHGNLDGTPTCSTTTCCWLPLSSAGLNVAIHCPGCLMPGIIVNKYVIHRNTFGLEDETNDEIADNSGTDITAAYSEFDELRLNRAIYGDEIVDTLIANFFEGDPFGNPGTLTSGYTYHNDMILPTYPGTNVMELNFLQLHRRFIPVNCTLNEMPQLTIEGYELYIDQPGTQACVNCPPNSGNLETILRLEVNGDFFTNSLPNHDEILFSFDRAILDAAIDDALNGVNFTEYLLGFAEFNEGQRYRLNTRYRVCTNFQAFGNPPPDNTLQRHVITWNNMFLNGSGLNLGNVNSTDQSPNSHGALHDEGFTFDPITYPFTEVNQTNFADAYKFYCETKSGGPMSYFSVEHRNTTSYNAHPDGSCNKLLRINAINTIAGNSKGDIFPYEFRPPPLFPIDWSIKYPSYDFTLIPSQPPIIYTALPNYNNAIVNQTFSFNNNPVPGPLPGFPFDPLIHGFSIIDNVTAPQIFCINDVTSQLFPATSTTPVGLFVQDEFSHQVIDIFLEPVDCIVQTLEPPSTYVPMYTADHTVIDFDFLTTGCPSSANCSVGTPLVTHNSNWPRLWFFPRPNFEAKLLPPDIIVNTKRVCWDFKVTNYKVTGESFTNASYVFLAVPDDPAITDYLSSWDVSINGAPPVSPFIDNIFYLQSDLPNITGPTGEIIGQVCASYELCSPTDLSFPFNFGWNCNEFPIDITDPNLCFILPVDATLKNEKIKFEPEISLSQITPATYTLCDNFSMTVCFKNLEKGLIKPLSIEFTGNFNPNISLIAGVEMWACDNPGSPTLLNQPNSNVYFWDISQTNLNDIDYGEYLEVDNCVCINIPLGADCGFDGVVPDIQFNYESYCGDDFSCIASFEPMDRGNPGTNCLDCYTVEKIANPLSVAPGLGIDLVTFTIKVCSDNISTPSSVVVSDAWPSNFYPTLPNPFGSGPLTVNFSSSVECKYYTLTGYFDCTWANPCDPCNLVEITSPITTEFTECVEFLPTCLSLVMIPPNSFSKQYQTSNFPFPVTSFSGTTLTIQGKFYINNFTILSGCTLKVEPGGEIILLNSNLLFMDDCHISACSRMWRGITATTNTFFLVQNSYISGAEFAIKANSGSTITAVNTTFDENYVGVYFPFVQLGNTASSHIESCTFTSIGNLPVPYSIYQTPLPDQWTFAGILAHRAMINLDFPGSLPNIFDGLSNGIIGLRSNLVIGNSKFINIKPHPFYNSQTYSIASTNYNGSAIYANGSKTISELRQSGFGLNQPSFINCKYGIFADNISLFSELNRMESMDFGYRVDFNRSQATIQHNYIESFKTAIDLRHNDGSLDLFVWDNQIHFGNVGFGTDYGIRVEETGLVNNGISRIHWNTITYNHLATSAKHGISLQNCLNYYVTQNVLNMDANISNLTGISIKGCIQTNVSCNEISSNSDFTPLNIKQQSAIFNYMGDSPVIGCNELDGTGNGIYVVGPVSNLITTELKGNKFDEHYFGLNYGVLSITSDQHLMGNEWLTLAFSGLKAINSGGNQAQKNFVAPGGATLLPLTTEQDPFDWFLPGSGSNFSCRIPNPIPTEPDLYNYCEDFPYDWVALRSTFDEEIARDSINPTQYADEVKWILKKGLYSKLHNNPSLISDSLMESFYSSMQSTFIAQLKSEDDAINAALAIDSVFLVAINEAQLMIDSINSLQMALSDSLLELLLHDGNVSEIMEVIHNLQSAIVGILATNENIIADNTDLKLNLISENEISVSALTPSTLIESNEKSVRQIFLSTIAKDNINFTWEQVSTLYDIAQQCPFTGGNAVFIARSIYSLLQSDIEYHDYENCYPDSIAARMIMQTNKEGILVMVYPNPAMDKITIDYEFIKNESGIFQLFTSSGQLLLTIGLSGNSHQKTLDVKNYLPGIYYYQVKTVTSNQSYGKLVIIR